MPVTAYPGRAASLAALLAALCVAAAPPAEPALTLESLEAHLLTSNPRLAQTAVEVDSARGRAVQAGLYPNPTLSATFDELGDRTGPTGINNVPQFTQEIVRGGKLRLDRAVAGKEVDQAAVALAAQRYSLLADLRAAYYEVLTLQRRVEILEEQVNLADKSVDQAEEQLKAKKVARLDVIQFEIEKERLRADRDASQQEVPAALARLAAAAGAVRLTSSRLSGKLEDPLPEYDLTTLTAQVLAAHPDLLSTRVALERAHLALKRARVEPVPNLTVSTGYIRQGQNRSNDWTLGFSMPLPVWNKNQGNIAAAEAAVTSATLEVNRVAVDLSDRVAGSYRDYTGARTRAARARDELLPRAKETYELSLKAYQGGQFEYLRVLEAQRSLNSANYDYVRTLGDAWKAAAALSGLAMEDRWPAVKNPLP